MQTQPILIADIIIKNMGYKKEVVNGRVMKGGEVSGIIKIH